jgi:outer membrane protein OmpA-like peptidoglycan-associated protein
MHKILNAFSIALIFLIFSSYTADAQRSLRKEGEKMFELERYHDALQAFQKYRRTKKDPRLLVKRAICYFKTGQPDKCIADMAAAHELKSLFIEKFLYMAESYLQKSDFEQAAKFYKIYLDKLELRSPEWYETVFKIKKCSFAINHRNDPQIAYVENLGSAINTIYDEHNPVQSPNQQERYYFSSCRETSTGGLMDASGLSDNVGGKYYADMYKVELKDGKWSSVLPFESELNSKQHDVLLDFSSDGNTMYFIKSKEMPFGELYADTFSIDRSNQILPTRESSLPFDPTKGDRDLSIFSDSLIFFSSSRFQGFGGYDIYYAFKHYSKWSEPINLGSTINSSYNEISPSITKNGLSMFFVSDRLEGFGGYDIFRSIYNTTTKLWTEPINQGLPINSPNDELDIELSADGTNMMFVSDKIGGIGGKDLYICYFKDQLLDQLDYIDEPFFVNYQTNQVSTKSDSVSLGELASSNNSYQYREFLNNSLFFQETEDVLNANNQNLIRKVIDLLLVYPQLKVRVTSHFTPETRPDFDLYFSIKRAEKISDYLISKGINSSRIFINGGGANFPIASHEIDGQPSTLAAKINRRIDIDFFNNEPKFNLKINYNEPIVADQFRENAWDNFVKFNTGLSFRVVYANANQMVQGQIFGIRKDACIEKFADTDIYTYTFGNTATYANARAIKTELIRLEQRQGFVIKPYLYGVPMSKDDIEKNKSTYSELEIFLRQE